jgi:tRNA 2-selenouridine synthase
VTIDIHKFFELRSQLPVVDVRSQGEYVEGHILNAINIPILNNEERVAVGTDYKQKGQQEAIKTGFRLVGPRLPEIIEAAERVADKKEILVHCWRGGMRSNNFCQFVGMAKIKSHQLIGGYKTYRQQALESFEKPFQFLVLGGCTGSGKSEILRALKGKGEQVIDLEALAHHKGSSFGGLMMPPQPTTEQFQNNLFEEILKLDLSRRIWIEDESLGIGKIFLPEVFWKKLQSNPLVEIQVEKEIRIERLVNEYGSANTTEFIQAMDRISKKLGGQHLKAAKEKYIAGDIASTIDMLLVYYDKAYSQNLINKKERIKHQEKWSGENVESFINSLLKNITI